MNRAELERSYKEVLERGCLSPSQQQDFLARRKVPGIVVQQSGGSSGSAPMRIPRTFAEMRWIAGRLFRHHVEAHGQPPARAAFVGGISHMEAEQGADPTIPVEVRSLSGPDRAELEDFDPEFLSAYPSFVREIVAMPDLRLPSLRTIKLGGEPILKVDRDRIFERFPKVVIVEQFGSTEMPALAWRVFTSSHATGYQLSTDRFEFAFAASDGWQRLIVCDTYPGRAFPIPGWFEMDDEGLIRQGELVAVRRTNDPVFPIRDQLENLFAMGCLQLQLMPREKELRYVALPGHSLRSEVELGGTPCRTSASPPYRLRGSNKLPLVLDTAHISRDALYVAGSPGPGSTLRG